MAEVVWTEDALDDVEEIAKFIARDSELHASLQVKRFFQTVERLELHPTSGKIVHEFKIPELRELTLGNYRIIYEVISETRVDILVVHHSRRLLENHPSHKTLKSIHRRKKK